MATITKTQGTTILTHTAITHPDTLKGSAQDVSTKLAATIFMYHALVEATANTNAGSFMVQTSAASSGDADWVTVAQFTANTGTADTEAMTATEPVGETVLAVASTTGFVAGDLLYVQNSTVGNSEWGLCQEIVSNTSINLVDGLTTQQTNTSVIWNDANRFICQLDLTAVGRLRVIFLHEGATGANCHVKAMMVTGDSIG